MKKNVFNKKQIDICSLTWAAIIPSVAVAVAAASVAGGGGAVSPRFRGEAVVHAPLVHACTVLPAIDGPASQMVLNPASLS